ncbi:GNAT family N-acetyltransferase [Nocardioides sp. JQ2195]|uniref:GNAT family N-acetyltransferase n=1 Tax=Nocardioides sp. JQ2195 TaxID=2592334 RepID=UPI00143E66EC|nr:GNAT family N-acetyltransferase [Nocardioides sp. JQ2195]QIX25323.1 GNAT family N-acetyltransferase [Nocardioides sp. JQ2195]
MPTLRPITADDHAFVLDLNQRNVELLSHLDEPRLAQLVEWADRADVIEHDGRRAGFVLTFAPGTDYDSENYVWFGERFGDRFYYLDRIVLDDGFRRAGLGRAAYDELERHAAAYGRMVLEVNVEPPNQPSLDFHHGRGYVELARLGGEKQVALMALGLDGPNRGRSGAAPGAQDAGAEDAGVQDRGDA